MSKEFRSIAEISQRKIKNIVFNFEVSKFSSRLHKIKGDEYFNQSTDFFVSDDQSETQSQPLTEDTIPAAELERGTYACGRNL